MLQHKRKRIPLLNEYLKHPTKELKEDLEKLKDGFIPAKYLMK